MSLSTYNLNVLKTELQKPEYNGMTADLAYAYLCLPTTTQVNQNTHLRLTPLVAAGALGPVKANALAQKVLQALPAIASTLMSVGVDLSDPATKTFLDSLVDGSTVMQADVDLLKALGTNSVSVTTRERFYEKFFSQNWPHVAADGTPGTLSDPPIRGFPNSITRPEFDQGWTAAGRT